MSLVDLDGIFNDEAGDKPYTFLKKSQGLVDLDSIFTDKPDVF